MEVLGIDICLYAYNETYTDVEEYPVDKDVTSSLYLLWKKKIIMISTSSVVGQTRMFSPALQRIGDVVDHSTSARIDFPTAWSMFLSEEKCESHI